MNTRGTQLPPQGELYSRFNIEHISDIDYKYVKRVWKVFEINNFGQYLKRQEYNWDY